MIKLDLIDIEILRKIYNKPYSLILLHKEMRFNGFDLTYDAFRRRVNKLWKARLVYKRRNSNPIVLFPNENKIKDIKTFIYLYHKFFGFVLKHTRLKRKKFVSLSSFISDKLRK